MIAYGCRFWDFVPYENRFNGSYHPGVMSFMRPGFNDSGACGFEEKKLEERVRQKVLSLTASEKSLLDRASLKEFRWLSFLEILSLSASTSHQFLQELNEFIVTPQIDQEIRELALLIQKYVKARLDNNASAIQSLKLQIQVKNRALNEQSKNRILLLFQHFQDYLKAHYPSLSNQKLLPIYKTPAVEAAAQKAGNVLRFISKNAANLLIGLGISARTANVIEAPAHQRAKEAMAQSTGFYANLLGARVGRFIGKHLGERLFCVGVTAVMPTPATPIVCNVLLNTAYIVFLSEAFDHSAQSSIKENFDPLVDEITNLISK